MANKIGPLLESAIRDVSSTSDPQARAAIAAHHGSDAGGDRLPLVVKAHTIYPLQGETWDQYRARVWTELEPLQDLLSQVMGIPSSMLYAANSLQANATPAQVAQLVANPQIAKLELDPLIRVVQMDDADDDIEMPSFRATHPSLDGGGVKVAVLDSGVDRRHPFLTVSDSVQTCGESVDIPGIHGTHCAGILASQDNLYSGVAPGVDLLNIKVLQANGSGKHTDITKGIDEALDRGAQVISMSLGFNHLPTWSSGGHGWSCQNGNCPLCLAVDNAVTLSNAVVVAAAGNWHREAESLRSFGFGGSFDTEMICPGQAREAISVGAMTKRSFLMIDFSSHGPTAYGLSKPDLCAPGVNITSTIPAPRDATGNLISNPPRNMLFARDSGTSMATPMVAGAAALLIQKRIQAGQSWTSAQIKQEIISGCTVAGTWPMNQAGAGRLILSNI